MMKMLLLVQATEECDDIDNDCDGEIDNGVLTTYYADTDGDSYGQESTLIEVCTGSNLVIISKMQETVMIQMLQTQMLQK